MINDTVDILDPMIINIGINFTAVVNFDQDKYEALNAGIVAIEEMFEEKTKNEIRSGGRFELV